MHEMNLSGVDLNLLPVLDALFAERHLTRAAHRVGLSQPAASHALGRLRTLFDDPLFIRARGGLVPTPRAEALREPVAAALATLRQALAPATRFDPATLRRAFRLGTSDYAELLFLSALASHVEREAPGVDLWCIGRGVDEIGDLVRGDTDLLVRPAGARDVRPGIRIEPLFEDRFVSVVRTGHPLCEGVLTVERFAAARHAFIAPGGRPGGAVDDLLQSMGLTRRVALGVPHFLVAPRIAATTDLVLTLPRRVARLVERDLPLVVLEPPLPLKPFAMSMLWHERQAGDAGHAWLRRTLADLVQAQDEAFAAP
jgi:DNA-binding transcriptional LysR family regulator